MADRRPLAGFFISTWAGKPNREAQELGAAFSAVVGLIDAGRPEEAEQAGRRLLVDYPGCPTATRLPMMYEARGERASCRAGLQQRRYRRMNA